MANTKTTTDKLQMLGLMTAFEFIANLDGFISIVSRITQIEITMHLYDFHWFDFFIKSVMAISLAFLIHKIRNIQKEARMYQQVTQCVNMVRAYSMHIKNSHITYTTEDAKNKIYDMAIKEEKDMVKTLLREENRKLTTDEVDELINNYYGFNQ